MVLGTWWWEYQILVGEDLPDRVTALRIKLQNCHWNICWQFKEWEYTLPVVMSHSTSCPLANPASNLHRAVGAIPIHVALGAFCSLSFCCSFPFIQLWSRQIYHFLPGGVGVECQAWNCTIVTAKVEPTKEPFDDLQTKVGTLIRIGNSRTWQESNTRTKPPWVPTAIKWVVAIQVGAPELTRSIAEHICDETALRITCLGGS